ncbi:hypothetical protein JTB14_004333 [Gonioctena quinquepunctata]|nr:hypothetical protein JTB14_004333 [Gonioctena quinquepunctata]
MGQPMDITGCVLEGLAYLHERGILYRDLKPENVIVHHNGYLKLADFGFAKQIDAKEKTFTFVGTAEYVAPEIILNKGYNKGADYWAFGVFIYELLVGKTPFRTNDPAHLQTYRMIMRGIDTVVFPYIVNNKAKSLIKKLCAQNSSDRLGCLKNGVEAIRKHPWYSNFEWDKLANLELEPPYKPQLSNNTDTRYFDRFPDEKDVPEDDFSEWANEF